MGLSSLRRHHNRLYGGLQPEQKEPATDEQPQDGAQDATPPVDNAPLPDEPNKKRPRARRDK